MVVRKRLKRLEMADVFLLISFEFFMQQGSFFGYDVQFPLDNANQRDMLLSQECREFHYILFSFCLIPITQTYHTQNTQYHFVKVRVT